MQNKKTLLQRMLAIYITFFVVLAVGLAHNLWPNFAKGYNEGSTLGQDIYRNWTSGTPREIFILGEVPLAEKVDFPIHRADTVSDLRFISTIRHLNLTIDQPAASGVNPRSLAFSSIGGSPWFYLLTMLKVAAYMAVIVLMFLIIHSIRRSIKEERTLARRNVWFLRSIGFLTIFAELSNDFMSWRMSQRAAELLAGSTITVDTTFTVSYTTIIMGILIIFTAEVCAIGQNLSEEQKLTI